MCTLFVARVAQSSKLRLALVGRRSHKNLDRGRHVEVKRLSEFLRGGLQLPNFSENPNNVRKWVGGVNACSDWKCPTLDNFGQFSKVQWLSRSVLLEVKNLCLLSISRSFLLLEARGRWELRINVDLPWPAQMIRPFSLAWQFACSRFTCQRH